MTPCAQGIDVDTICGEYENGTSLHIAAANLSVEAARILLSFGADKDLLDDLARKPVDCVPDPEDFDLIPDAPDLIVKMRKLLNIRDSIQMNFNIRNFIVVQSRHPVSYSTREPPFNFQSYKYFLINRSL